MRKFLSAFLFALVGAAAPSNAQETDATMPMAIIADCASSQLIKEFSLENYDEIGFIEGNVIFRRFDGQFSEGQMKMYANPTDLTFTLTVNFPDGVGCIVFMGNEMLPIYED